MRKLPVLFLMIKLLKNLGNLLLLAASRWEKIFLTERSLQKNLLWHISCQEKPYRMKESLQKNLLPSFLCWQTRCQRKYLTRRSRQKNRLQLTCHWEKLFLTKRSCQKNLLRHIYHWKKLFSTKKGKFPVFCQNQYQRKRYLLVRLFKSPGNVTTCCPLFGKTLLDEKILSEKPVVAHPLLGEVFPDEKILPEEPVVAYPSLGEAIPDEKISPKERDVVLPLLAAISDKKISPEDPVTICFPDGYHATEEPYAASDVSANERTIYSFAKPISTETTQDKAVSQVPAYGLVLFDPHASSNVDKNLKREPLAALCSPAAAGNGELDVNSPLSCGSDSSFPDPPESLVSGPVESVKIWSNGSLLGLEPSKPPVFAVPSSVNLDYIKTKNNGGVNGLATEKTERSDKSVEVTDNFQSVPSIGNEKASLPLAASEPNSQHTSQLGHTNGSHQQNTTISFGVFGLCHRLFMNGFQRNSSVSNIKSLPASTNTEAALEEKADFRCQPTHESIFLNEPFGCQSLFSSPPSSPLEHMKISFDPINGFADSKLKLKIPCQPQYHMRKMHLFSSFQLVSGVASPHNNASDSDDENHTFCGSSPCISDDHYSDHSTSSSEMWESDESPEGNNETSSFSQVVDRSACDGISMEPYLDIPCFDAMDLSLVTETQHRENHGTWIASHEHSVIHKCKHQRDSGESKCSLPG